MRILHCINSAKIGGLERLVIDLALAQKEKGMDVWLMLDKAEGDYLATIKAQDLPILISRLKHGFDFSLTTYRYLLNQFNNYDIVHLHNFSFTRSYAALKSRAKVVYTIHGLSKGIRKENKVKYILREALKKYTLNKVDGLVANSQHTLNHAKLHYSLSNIKTEVVLNGISGITGIEPNKQKRDKQFVIGLVSRFVYRKRIDRLITAFKYFLEEGGQAQVVMVGDGQMFGKIKEQVTRLGLEKQVTMVGYSNNVHSYYRKFDVLVHPSDNEGFGLIAVEAYLHGLPVIVFEDSGGLREVVEPLEPENIIDDEQALAKRLLWYYKNQNQIKQGKDKRIVYAKQNFTMARMQHDYFEIYNRLLK